MKGGKINIVNNLAVDDEVKGDGEGSEGEGEGGDILGGANGIRNEDINPAIFDSENQRYDALVSELNAVKNTINGLKVTIDKFTSSQTRMEGTSVVKDSHDRLKQYDERIKNISDQMENDKQELKTMLDETKNEMKQTLSAIQNSGNIPSQLGTRQPEEQHEQQQQQQTQNNSVPTTVPGNSNQGSYSEYFLNKMRNFRNNNMIIFNLSETDDEWVDGLSQKYIDEQEIGTILDHNDDEDLDLKSKVVEITRLGRKSDGKIRPVRVRFESVFYRDAAVMNGFKLKYREDYFNKVKMCKDLIREDRDKAKAEYERKKQLRISNANAENRPVDNSDQITPMIEINRPVATGGDQGHPPQVGQMSIT